MLRNQPKKARLRLCNLGLDSDTVDRGRPWAPDRIPVSSRLMCEFECHEQADSRCSNCYRWGCHRRGHLITCEACEGQFCAACFDAPSHGGICYYWPCCALTPQPSFRSSVGVGCVAVCVDDQRRSLMIEQGLGLRFDESAPFPLSPSRLRSMVFCCESRVRGARSGVWSRGSG